MPEQIATSKTFVNGVHFSLKDYPNLIYQLEIRVVPKVMEAGEITVTVAIEAFYKGFIEQNYTGCNLTVYIKRHLLLFSGLLSVNEK